MFEWKIKRPGTWSWFLQGHKFVMISLLTWNSSQGLTIMPSLNHAYSAISPIAFISIVKSDPSSIVWSTKSVNILGGGASIKSWHFASASPPEKNGS